MLISVRYICPYVVEPRGDIDRLEVVAYVTATSPSFSDVRAPDKPDAAMVINFPKCAAR